jgi:hypothetical protein
VLARYWGDLNLDPDAYLTLARGLAEGRGLSIPGTTMPTAFRPPLYPLLLIPICWEEDRFWRAGLHLALAAGTIFCIWLAAGQLGQGRWQQVFAAGIYAIDPLSLRYVAYSMTETLCAFLASLLLVRLTRSGPPSLRREFVTGLVFGLCVLARPTFWIFGILFAAVWLAFRACILIRAQERVREEERLNRRFSVVAALLGILLCATPWVLRNWLQLGAPILMTTHGGYTVLLGNNDDFYREVVNQPLGTIWDGAHGGGQEAWFVRLNERLKELGITSEPQSDRWMAQQAWQTIREQPGEFLKACGLKFVWFWNILPQSPGAQSLPRLALLIVGSFYALLWLLLMAGFFRLLLRASASPDSIWPWQGPVLLIVAFSAIHLVYWSDARMRAPIVPAIALVCAAAWPERKTPPAADSAVRGPTGDL